VRQGAQDQFGEADGASLSSSSRSWRVGCVDGASVDHTLTRNLTGMSTGVTSDVAWREIGSKGWLVYPVDSYIDPTERSWDVVSGGART
jgi:hypothetical protein